MACKSTRTITFDQVDRCDMKKFDQKIRATFHLKPDECCVYRADGKLCVKVPSVVSYHEVSMLAEAYVTRFND